MAYICNLLNILALSITIGLFFLYPAPSFGNEPGKVISAPGKSHLRSDLHLNADRIGPPGAGNRFSMDLPKDQTAVKASGQKKMAVNSGKEPPLMLRNISVKFGPGGHERVFIEFNREIAPEISSIGGKDPRIVIDVKSVLSMRQGLKNIDVQGKLIRQIRSNLDYASRQLRIVIDLAPSRNYDVEPVFYRAEKIYMVDITEAATEKKK
jgi:hypothetical protein